MIECRGGGNGSVRTPARVLRHKLGESGNAIVGGRCHPALMSPEADRPRERFWQLGASALAAPELLAILGVSVGTGVCS
jgi:hypothetical protein